ncbi:MAG: hypothetical protein RH862_05460 [Leptospiraceae bacterium]
MIHQTIEASGNTLKRNGITADFHIHFQATRIPIGKCKKALPGNSHLLNI